MSTKEQKDLRKNIVKGVETMLEDALIIDRKFSINDNYDARLDRAIEIAKLLQLEYLYWIKKQDEITQ